MHVDASYWWKPWRKPSQHSWDLWDLLRSSEALKRGDSGDLVHKEPVFTSVCLASHPLLNVTSSMIVTSSRFRCNLYLMSGRELKTEN